MLSPAFILAWDFSRAESGVWLFSCRHGEMLTVELMVEGNLSYWYLFTNQSCFLLSQLRRKKKQTNLLPPWRRALKYSTWMQILSASIITNDLFVVNKWHLVYTVVVCEYSPFGSVCHSDAFQFNKKSAVLWYINLY